MTIPSIVDADVEKSRVFVRVDYDVPLSSDGTVEDFSKLEVSLPTLKLLIEKRAKIIIGSHLGTPGGRLNRKFSLEPVGAMLSELLDKRIYFPDNSIGDSVRKITSDMMPGDVVLLENLDFHRGERECYDKYARGLANSASVYVNEAFSLSDQKRASLVTVPEYMEHLYAGLNFHNELSALNRLSDPEKPFVVIAGGSDAPGKIDFMESFLDSADTFLVSGAPGNILYSVTGRETGKTELDKDAVYKAKKFISSCDVRGIRLALADDVVAVRADLKNGPSSFIISGDRVPKESAIVDIGPETRAYYARIISNAKTVLWYGAPGDCAERWSSGGTEETARALTSSEAYGVVIGEETVTGLTRLGCVEGVGYISAGGEAAVKYLRDKTLPVVSALESKIHEKKVRNRQLEDEYAEE